MSYPSPTNNEPRIRYSGDLELRLSFDNSPLKRPSNNLHKEAQDWFEEAKARTLERQRRDALEAAEASKYPPKPSIAFPEQGHFNHNNTPKSGGFGFKKTRPAGPRPDEMGYPSKDQFGTMGFGNNNMAWKDAPFYRQARCWVALLSGLASFATFALFMALLHGTVPAAISASKPLLPIASCVSGLVSIASIVMYLIYPLGYGTPFRVADGVLSSTAEAIAHVGLVVLWVFGLRAAVGKMGECSAAVGGLGSACALAFACVSCGILAATLILMGAGKRLWEIGTSGMLRRAFRRH
ncbi:hypothetical protein HDV00_009138 [Rhizophlyctis rosea]|nr:hypothetical protein HDV00_009138 [Rhizophlyctis rosea]